MNVLHLYVPNAAELLDASYLGPGALIRVERSATLSGTYSEIATAAIGPGTAYYTVYDSAGVDTSWYRSRYSNAGGSAFTAYSNAWQERPGIFSLAEARARLGITAVTDTKDDDLIRGLITAITNTLQNISGCWFQGDTADQILYFDGNESRGGMVLPVSVGIQSITTLELATMTGGSYAVVPTNAYFLDPPRPDPGFPFTSIAMSDQPMGWWYRFYPGKRTVKATGKFGWAVWPEDVRQIGFNVLIRLYRARASGEGDVVGTTALGNAIVARRISPEERKMLNDIYGDGPAIG